MYQNHNKQVGQYLYILFKLNNQSKFQVQAVCTVVKLLSGISTNQTGCYMQWLANPNLNY